MEVAGGGAGGALAQALVNMRRLQARGLRLKQLRPYALSHKP
jgi:hypothetical protein